MKSLFLATAAIAIGTAGSVTGVQAADVPPPWAYGFTAPPATPPVATPAPAAQPPALDNTTELSVQGSSLKFTRAQIANRFGPADWFPQDHGPMPDIVAHGKEGARPPVFACSLCHYPNGFGRPENANIAGLSYEYIVDQLNDFKNGARKSSDPRKNNTNAMAGFAKNMNDDEINEAAKYFSSIAYKPWVKVVESDTVPKTRPQAGLFLTLDGEQGGTEPIGDRIVETPVSVRDSEFLRNDRSGFIAYVPPGSIKKGEQLVTTGNGKVTACTACHGSDLRGLGPVPSIAGRSPSYLARQLYDIQHGNRTGKWTPLMAPVVSKLDSDDILNAVAYIASLEP